MRDLAICIENVIGCEQNAMQRQLNTRPDWGVVLLADGAPQAAIAPEHVFEAGGLNQLAIAHAVEQTGVEAQTEVVLEESDMRRGESGILRFLPPGLRLQVGDVRQLSLSISDYTASAMLVRVLGGPNRVNVVLQDDRHLQQTRLHTVDDANNHFTYGTTTALESAYLHHQLMDRPIDREAMAHGHFVDGARSRIEIHPEKFAFPAARLLKKEREQIRTHRQPLYPDGYNTLVRAQIAWTPRSNFPNIGTADPNRHEIIQIGNMTLAALSHGYNPETDHFARQVQAQLGMTVYRFAVGTR